MQSWYAMQEWAPATAGGERIDGLETRRNRWRLIFRDFDAELDAGLWPVIYWLAVDTPRSRPGDASFGFYFVRAGFIGSTFAEPEQPAPNVEPPRIVQAMQAFVGGGSPWGSASWPDGIPVPNQQGVPMDLWVLAQPIRADRLGFRFYAAWGWRRITPPREV